jgi:hypothetical protein
MTVSLLQDCNFGSARANVTGSFGVGYTVSDSFGNVVQPFTTIGVYQVAAGSGIYAANVTYPDQFNGQIVWTCPATSSSFGDVLPTIYATEQYNAERSYELLSGTIVPQVQGLYDVAFGCWKIDTTINTMTFYRGADATSPVVATFNLFDDSGNPTYDGVFMRVLNGTVTP